MVGALYNEGREWLTESLGKGSTVFEGNHLEGSTVDGYGSESTVPSRLFRV